MRLNINNKMAKRKSKKKQSWTPDQTEDLQGTNAENTNQENKNMQNPHEVIVFGIYIHCPGCADTIMKHLRGFDGVEQIDVDMKNHKVTVKGKIVDPEKVMERLRKKSNKYITLISHTVKKEENEEESKVVEVVLKIYMHCEGCAADIKYNIHKMQGVLTVETNMKNSQVVVKGMFDPENLVDFIDKRTGKNAVVMKQRRPEKKEDRQW